MVQVVAPVLFSVPCIAAIVTWIVLKVRAHAVTCSLCTSTYFYVIYLNKNKAKKKTQKRWQTKKRLQDTFFTQLFITYHYIMLSTICD